ncbi:hypothetical protein BCR34DRAFT_1268 [Clohesyomyces aquaticus]|uniref:Heme haloperoxidase family profile domain-containing protein n=1 Tax=Clohesyomyces aquaticus TaxID=1231657 RepID=A0A1Y2AAY5_9PLEO|nr:hypothetical protein BCR34DRAFT_1268 [Clohesyomyces aquaticus]
MKIKLAILAITGIGSGLRLDFGQWHPLVPGDVRSPCPALNSLANHCFLPCDGKNLSVPLVERQKGPKLMHRIPDKVNSYTESAIYRQVLNNPKTRLTPLQFVKVFFEEEQLPYSEGWRTPQEVVHSFTFLANVLPMALATPEKDNMTGRMDADAFRGLKFLKS